MMLLLAVVQEEMPKLLAVYRKPEGAADARAFAELYADICRELTPEQYRSAVTAYLKSDARYFPKPGTLLALGRAVSRPEVARQGYDAWEYSEAAIGGRTPCPVCGEYWQAQPTGRWECWHSEPAHVATNGHYIGRPLRDALRRRHEPDAVMAFMFPGAE